MKESLLVPHFAYRDEIEVDGMVEVRAALKPLFEAHGLKLSYMPLILKATSLALAAYPQVNASVSADETSVTYHADHNIAIAMDTPRGLLVPNVKRVQDKSLLEIAADLNELQALGAAGKLGEAQLTGGTFSLSNIGNIGGTYMSPVIMVPQVAIGAIGKIQKVPRFDSAGAVVPRSVMQISWAADHRVLDGATIARFSNVWKTHVENPSTMLAALR